jgi:hypothetical protein
MVKTSKDRRLSVHIHHLERLLQHQLRLSKVENRFPWIRFIVLIIGISSISTAARLGGYAAGILIAILSSTVFIGIVHQHQRIIQKIEKTRTHILWITSQAARMSLDWAGIPQSRSVKTNPDHPFEKDLNLIGDRSLHHLINIACSRGGNERLQAWLLNPNPNIEEIRARQGLVRELTP